MLVSNLDVEHPHELIFSVSFVGVCLFLHFIHHELQKLLRVLSDPLLETILHCIFSEFGDVMFILILTLFQFYLEEHLHQLGELVT